MKRAETLPLIIVTGLSGAGKSTVLHVLEDLRFFAIDGLPVGVAADVVTHLAGDAMRQYRGVVLGMDMRQYDFLQKYAETLSRLSEAGIAPRIIFLEAESNVLVRRFATTRRPHPLENGETSLDLAVEKERHLLEPVRETADLVVDTSDFSIHQLRRVIQKEWSNIGGSLRSLRVNLISFGFKHAMPADADMMFDLRFLPNPYFDENLRELTGKDNAIQKYVLDNGAGRDFKKKFLDFLLFLLPQYEAEGRYRITIALGCTGGKHRSVAVTEVLAEALKQHDYPVAVEHRHIHLL